MSVQAKARPRYKTPAARPVHTNHRAPRTAEVQEKPAEQSWFIFIMAVFLALGVGLIGAVTYILLLG